MNKAKLEAAFAANHDRLVELFYRRGELTPDQHNRLHTMNWLLLEKKFLDLNLEEDLPVAPEAPPGSRGFRSQEVAEMLSQISIADVGWKAIGLKTTVEILRETGL